MSKSVVEKIKSFIKKEYSEFKEPDNIEFDELSPFKKINTTLRYNLCTVVGKDYIPKVIAFYNSLNMHSENFSLWIFCIDNTTHTILKKMNFNNATLVPIILVENKYTHLKEIKNTRATNEYCWTLKPIIMQYVLDVYKEDSIIYCDSDLFFFGDVSDIYKDWGDKDIYLCPQRDLQWVEDLYGEFQAGLIGVKNTEEGKSAVKWWAKKCEEWCYKYSDKDNGRYGDQKYLDWIKRMFVSVKISKHLGINAAPWNTIYNNNFKVEYRENSVYIENYKLIVFHFACLDVYSYKHFDLWNLGTINVPYSIKKLIYIPYIRAIQTTITNLGSYNIEDDIIYTSKSSEDIKTSLDLSNHNGEFIEYYNFCTVVSKKYVIKFLSFYDSITNHATHVKIWVCCMDNLTYSILSSLDLEKIILIKVGDFLSKELENLTETRTLTELCWTLKPIFINYVLNKYKLADLIYCDADMYFFESPEKVYKIWESNSYFMCLQRDKPEFEKVYGSFQAGFLGFKQDKHSLAILEWWKKMCINWCFDTHDVTNQRWGDQKYLDCIPMLFTNIKLIDDLGINAAPWNTIYNNNYLISKKQDKVYIKDEELIVFHFGSFNIFNKNEYDLWKLFEVNIDENIMQFIYCEYIKSLRKNILKVENLKDIDKSELFIKINEWEVKNYYIF